MGGLKRVAKIYGGMNVTDKDGNTTEWIYDYATDQMKKRSEMTEEEFRASEKAKWERFFNGKND